MLVSVILPTYNCASYLPYTIESVLGQEYNDLELIVVDDGSTDNTAEIVEPFHSLASFRYLPQKNQGVSIARNNGIKSASGEFIAFIDADDIWYPEKLSVQIGVLTSNPDLLGVFSDFDRADVNGMVTAKHSIKVTYPVFKQFNLDWPEIFQSKTSFCNCIIENRKTNYDIYYGDIFRSLFLGNFINTCSVVLRKRVIQECGYFNPERKTQEDYEFWLKIAATGPLAYIDESLLFYRRRADQLTSQKNLFEIHKNSLEVLENVLASELGDRLDANDIESRMSRKHAEYAKNLLGLNRKHEARYHILKSIKFRFFSPYFYILFLWSFLPGKLEQGIRKFIKAMKVCH